MLQQLSIGLAFPPSETGMKTVPQSNSSSAIRLLPLLQVDVLVN